MQSPNLTTRDIDTQRAPPAEDVRAELERILSDPSVQASQRRRAFLRFIVEETLAGRGDRLKGYTVAVAVFGRDESFDSQTDPVVRLEARRLRRDLDSYYVDAGSRNAVRISIPKGSYVPHFEWQEASQPGAAVGEQQAMGFGEPSASTASTLVDTMAGAFRTAPRKLLTAAMVTAVFIIATVGWILMAGKEPSTTDDTVREPAVVVLPFEALSSTEDSRHLASGISQELIGNLMRFPGFRLYTLPISFESDAAAEPVELGRGLGVAYVVNGTVNADGREIRVTAQLFDATSGQVLWTETYDRPLTPNALIGIQRDLAGEIATVLGQPYGVLNSDLDFRATSAAVSTMQSYVCVLRAYDYRRTFSREAFDPVLGCLEETVRRDPDYSDAWAMLGLLRMDAGRIGYVGYGDMEIEYEQALRAASQAVHLAPESVLGLKTLAAVNHYLGRYDESERLARRALELNPYDPETMAQLGWRLAVRGDFEEGIPILKRAIERTVNPPGWYFHLIAVDHYLKGDYARMLRVAQRSAIDGRGVSQALIAIAAAELGNPHVTREALSKMSVSESFAGDPAAYLRRHGATDVITNALMGGLRKAQRIASTSQGRTRVQSDQQ